MFNWIGRRNQRKANSSEFHHAFYGRFVGILSWAQLEDFWTVLRAQADKGWYIYAIGLSVPQQHATVDDVESFIDAVDKLLREEHKEDYCGIVYADDSKNPTFVKIYDPNHLGVSCGCSKNPPLPGWSLSLIRPQHLEGRRVLPANRVRWWQSLEIDHPRVATF